MNKYRVLVNGRNFVIRDADTNKDSKMGFYVNVFVEAKNPEEAEYAAVDVVWKDEWFKNPSRNSKDDPPALYVEEIYQLKSFKGYKRPRQGFIFYPETRESKAKKKYIKA